MVANRKNKGKINTKPVKNVKTPVAKPKAKAGKVGVGKKGKKLVAKKIVPEEQIDSSDESGSTSPMVEQNVEPTFDDSDSSEEEESFSSEKIEKKSAEAPIVESLESDEDEDEEEDEEEEIEVKKHVPVVKPVKAQSSPQVSAATNNDSEFPPSTRLFVTNLPYGATKEVLSEFFQTHDLYVTDIFVPGGNKSFAFVEFKSIDEARKAISISGADLNGSCISINFAKPRGGSGDTQQRSNETNILFVKNLGPSATQEELEDHFGNVKEVRLMTNQDGTCKGHAFVEFSSTNEAKAAKEKLAGSSINGSKIVVDFAQPRGSKPNHGGGGDRGFGRGNFRGNRGGGRFQGRGGGRGSFHGNNRGSGGGRFFGNSSGRGGGVGKSRFNNQGGDFQKKSQKITFADD